MCLAACAIGTITNVGRFLHATEVECIGKARWPYEFRGKISVVTTSSVQQMASLVDVWRRSFASEHERALTDAGYRG
jgi:hypothetical protein